MGAPSMSMNDAARLAALQKYAILDTEPEQAFDDLTLLASYVCKTPIALISLIDENRQWFKSKVGISATETSRDIALAMVQVQSRDFGDRDFARYCILLDRYSTAGRICCAGRFAG